MRLECQVPLAVALDALVGDPRRLPHPVRAIGRVATALERLARRTLGASRFSGLVVALSVYAITGAAAFGAIRAAGLLHAWAADVVAVLCIWWAVAARDLADHAMAVYRPLAALAGENARTGENLEAARAAVGAIVGRDTRALDEAGVARAAVESVAESTVDGVCAPLVWAVVAGPVGAIVYRAINTLDSMFGHRDERYLRFGWASARIDDAANYLPARIAAPAMCVAARLLRLRAADAWRILRRDGRRHESPNAGLVEAAAAGALGVQLGGTVVYDGVPVEKPTLGDPVEPLTAVHIRRSVALMWATSAVVLTLALVARYAAVEAYNAWSVSG